jgi:hypothetical protein
VSVSLLGELGAWGVTFHDDDLTADIPEHDSKR